ncbi:MAG: DUF6036 family nucleotidyltransferase [Nocardioides sp.]
MDRLQLAHVLRAACRITEDADVVVLGSQAILGTYDEDELPAAATMSMEADLAWLADSAHRERADLVTGAIGELSSFHETNGYYPEGISIQTATLPEGWQERLRTWELASAAPAHPRFLEPYDLAVAKLAAHRAKDLDFVTALIDHGLS